MDEKQGINRGMSMKRFTAYRRSLSECNTHNHYQKNADDEPQFEGVIWTDGTVTLRWLTLCSSHSIWANIEDCLNIHGHPGYGTEIIWHDGPAPEYWVAKLKENNLQETPTKEWIGLTEQDIKDCEKQAMVNGSLPFEQRSFFARALEAKLKEKNA